MKTKKFSISMPQSAYDHYQEKAQKAGLSISQFLYRAGSITSVEEAVLFPLKQHSQEGLGSPPLNTTYQTENQKKVNIVGKE